MQDIRALYRGALPRCVGMGCVCDDRRSVDLIECSRLAGLLSVSTKITSGPCLAKL